MQRKKGLLLIKPDSADCGQLMKYEIMQYLRNKGCDFLQMRYLVLTDEFLSLHYADIKEARPNVYQDIVNRFEGQIVTALEVELPMTLDNNYQLVPMSCEEFRDTIIGPTFIHKEGIREKVEKEYKKSGKPYIQKDVEVATELRYAAAQKTMRGKIANQLNVDQPKKGVTAEELKNYNDDLKTFNACHYSASAEEARAELYRVFSEVGFDGRIVSRIIERAEINTIMSKVGSTYYDSQKDTKAHCNEIRKDFDTFKQEMIDRGEDIPEDILIERFLRSYDTPQFHDPKFRGDKIFNQFSKDMKEVSNKILNYAKEKEDESLRG